MQHRHGLLLFATLILFAAGCGGLTQLSETTPVRVAAAPPPPPEPPPPEEPPVVEVTEQAVEVHQTINFAFDSDEIDSSSFGLMNEIVRVVQEHDEIRRLRIEGHTDNVGSDSYNRDLSARRARAVMRYLTEHGVEEGRLRSEGYGASRPVASNETDAGRAQNRRVEFNILERAEPSQDAQEAAQVAANTATAGGVAQ